MKRLLVLTLAISVICIEAFCGIGIYDTLNQAQEMLRDATTVAQCEAAKKKFKSAKYEVGYVPAEHDRVIDAGIRNCDKKIKELSSRLSLSSTSLSFSATGGSKTLSINTNLGTPTASALPSWITVTSISSSSITVRCSANSSTTSRYDWFNISAGNKTIRVDVTQRGSERINLRFTGSSFGNVEKNGDVIDSYGSTLYASSVRYLKWRISYEGPSIATTKNCYIKIVDPDGQLETGSSSPSGYTFSQEITFSSGNNYATCKGWGNASATAYKPGTYRFELWYDGSKQYSASVTLQRKPGEASYLTVDSKTAVNASFESGRDYETFYVSTDADSWTTWGVPSWVSITEKTKSSFKIVCDANTSTSSRSDYMKILAGDKEVRINIEQKGLTRAVTIESVWDEHNVFFGLNKGMKIHAKVRTAGYKGSKFYFYCYFYYGDNTTPLKTQAGGQVQVSTWGNVLQDDGMWNDLTLNMPYLSLNMAPGFTGTLSYDLVIKDSSGNVLARKDNNTFSFSRW